ncbi:MULTISPECIES: cysteine rich repeat-containing protein [unclassified Rhizobium]|jgi:hypothetical protein|uniref:cysteine rich repeat-containing protein n=1 Tax=Rhizobium sp. BG4 TaxID=2613770 RepID=UPI00193D3646|nr:cysteine rich repeat-containing protein [Rhizobium sp. BG4]QRM47039.1 hypothetical protein F2982_27395 [Rhizobium sp. BG4]
MLKRRLLLAAVACMPMIFAATVSAQTLSYADAVTKLADDCGKDIQKLCKGLNLGGGRIADCLQQNADKVSPTCKASLATVFQSITQREHAQTAYRQVCQRDMSKSCSGIKGDGFVLACLVKKEPRVSKECNQVITDAGWR